MARTDLPRPQLDAVFDVTNRDFQPDPDSAHKGGRVIEMLSEHTLQGLSHPFLAPSASTDTTAGFCQGYILTGRHAVFPSYESFLGIISTMLLQYAKFGKMAQETNWRQDIAAITYIETSTWTRQEHNGFSHQNPRFVSHLPPHVSESSLLDSDLLAGDALAFLNRIFDFWCLPQLYRDHHRITYQARSRLLPVRHLLHVFSLPSFGNIPFVLRFEIQWSLTLRSLR